MGARFGYVPITSQLVDDVLSAEISTEYASAFGPLGGEEWGVDVVSDPAPLLVFVTTGGTERSILDLLRRRADTAGRTPALLVAHSGDNSLPAALETLARLQQDGERGRIVYLDSPSDAAGLAMLERAVRDIETRQAMRQSRIGVIGSPSGWLVASSPDPAIVRSKWGPQVVPVSLDQLLQAIRTAAGEAAHTLGKSLMSGATEIREPSQGEIEVAVHVTTAVQQLSERHGLTAVALRCFDLVSELGTTGCVALSQLADDGIAAGCEGDLVSTVAMIWVRELLGETSWMANPSRVNLEENTLVAAHCTVPRSMTTEYRLRSHFESGGGVAVQGTLREGPVTLLRIGGKQMEDLWLAEGEILRCGDSDKLCRTQAEVRLTDGSTVGDLLESPLGNHVVLVSGNHAGRLGAWWEMMIEA